MSPADFAPRHIQRRDLLKGAGATLVAGLAACPAFAAAAPTPPVEIHLVSPDDVRDDHVRPGWMNWSPQAGLARAGGPALLAYAAPWAGDVARGRRLARLCNRQAARVAGRHPGGFAVLASLPSLADPEGARAEIAHAFDSLGAAGVVVLTRHDGRRLDDPAAAPVWDELDRRGALVFVQPSIPALPGLQPGALAARQLDAAGAVARLRAAGRWARVRFAYAAPGAGPALNAYWWASLPQRAAVRAVLPSLTQPA